MQKYIIGKKIGMTQLFDENGKFIPVTVIEAGPCIVTQKKTIENDGYEAVQIGYGEISEKALTKPMMRPLCQGRRCPQEVPQRVPGGQLRREECRRPDQGRYIRGRR